MPVWDPGQYLRYADERSRSFFELTARIGAGKPRTVVDLGCGPGQLTATLADRWPQAAVVGIDSSAEMIAAAQQYAGPGLEFRRQDLTDFAPAEPVDVIVSNATLQWVDDHRAVLPRLVEALAPDGWLAFQVPGNQTAPSHTLLHQLGQDPRFSRWTGAIDRRVMPPAADYLADLAGLGLQVDAWETTYLHVLPGENAVFDWVSGTGARPYLQSLPDEQREVFAGEYKALLREAYPRRWFGTVLEFRRIFAVGHRG
ncbi:MAG: methyltransferase domain-containing protein [Microlunatus sp.]|nr:methyltransferase domain-containing protein [Microlunatus sp.]